MILVNLGDLIQFSLAGNIRGYGSVLSQLLLKAFQLADISSYTFLNQ